jgi:cyclopropane-fatty-acyl-phospholipid synthase
MTTFTASLPIRTADRPIPRLRSTVTALVLDRMLDGLPIRAYYPDGSSRGAGGEDAPALQIVRPASLVDRLSRNPKIGLGEGYMAGDWRAADGTDLGALLTPFAERLTGLVPRPLQWFRSFVDERIPQLQRNTVEGSRANIEAHYDLSNELFAGFLDETMTYSSAMFDGAPPYADQPLATAQQRKIGTLLDRAQVGRGTRLLEIGTGWGGLALVAARRGARVTSVTLSSQQLALAQRRVDEAGLADLVELRLQDYREVRGRYDAVVSVEMIEAVGEEFWPEYFSTLDRLLAPGGTIAIQSILMDHHRLLATRSSFGWIQKYIFPGGLIPSVRAIDDTLTEHTGLRVAERHHFGIHYAETLRRWRERFSTEWPTISRLGFDETFRRTWEFYLAYCEAGFASGYLDVAQLQLVRRAA